MMFFHVSGLSPADQHPAKLQCRRGLSVSRGDPGRAQCFPRGAAAALWYGLSSRPAALRRSCNFSGLTTDVHPDAADLH